MQKTLTTIAKTPIIGSTALLAYRASICGGYWARYTMQLIKWLFKSKETTNFTYHLQEDNKRYLAAMIDDIVNVGFDTVMEYIAEIEQDAELRQHISAATARSNRSFTSDRDAKFGRRIGWYAIARAVKPKTIVETGVDKGLGACVLVAALRKNKMEGYEGRYFGTDINRDAGYLLAGEYANFGCILYGDSIESLKALDERIDLFINDSDHSADYEANEYLAVEPKLSEHAILLGDNAHCTTKLLEFSQATGRRFAYFQEAPRDHWYPGAGIGFSFKR